MALGSTSGVTQACNRWLGRQLTGGAGDIADRAGESQQLAAGATSSGVGVVERCNAGWRIGDSKKGNGDRGGDVVDVEGLSPD